MDPTRAIWLLEKEQTCRSVAQPGSALAWGARGPEFKSRRSDQLKTVHSGHIGNDLYRPEWNVTHVPERALSRLKTPGGLMSGHISRRPGFDLLRSRARRR